MRNLKLALDWTPNTNHIGFLVAKEKGLYYEKDINLEIIDPSSDNYKITPGKKLELGEVDFAIAPFESIISFNNKSNPIDFTAIYAVLQNDLSSIATLKSSGINSPNHLDGKKYASYKARYEDYIVQEMIKNDSGKGELGISYPEKLGIWETLLKGKADATWIFDNWEGVEATENNINLNTFKMSDYDVPYCYSPIIMAKRSEINKYKDEYISFVEATRNGFLFAANNPKESSEILRKFVTEYDSDNIDLEKSIEFTAPHFGDMQTAGKMNPNRVIEFLEWLISKELEGKQILKQELFTNELFS